MTYEEYAEALNAHANTCEVCTLARKQSTTHGVCEEGRRIVDEFKASKHTAEDLFLAQINALAKELKQLDELDEASNAEPS